MQFKVYHSGLKGYYKCISLKEEVESIAWHGSGGWGAYGGGYGGAPGYGGGDGATPGAGGYGATPGAGGYGATPGCGAPGSYSQPPLPSGPPPGAARAMSGGGSKNCPHCLISVQKYAFIGGRGSKKTQIVLT